MSTVSGLEIANRIEAEWRDRLEAAVKAERDACAKVCRSEANRALWNYQNDLPRNNEFWNGAEQMASNCENLIKTRVSA